MKLFLIFLLFSFDYAMADITSLLKKEETIGCKAVSFSSKEEKPSCSKKKHPTRIVIAPIKIPKNSEMDNIKRQLNNIMNEFSSYKKEKDRESQKMRAELENMLKEFSIYKVKEQKKIKKIKNKLSSTIRELSKNRKKLVLLQKSKKRKIAEKELIVKKEQFIEKKRIVKKERIIEKEREITETEPSTHKEENLPWIEIVVEKGIDIYQLALRYYGNKKEYRRIYVANQNYIGTDLKIEEGIALKIPMTPQFKEQPFFLNLD